MTSRLAASVVCPECGEALPLEGFWWEQHKAASSVMYQHYIEAHPEYKALYVIDSEFENWHPVRGEV